MDNSAIYDRFIDMFLESADDYEPYGVVAPNGNMPQQVDEDRGAGTDDIGTGLVYRMETDY